MKNLIKIEFVLIVSLFSALQGCKKENDLLNTKPNQALNIPSSLQDLQLLLQNESVFNQHYPALGEVSSDDYFFDYSSWQNAFGTEQNAYLWAKDIYITGDNNGDWRYPYQMVYYANLILKTIPDIQVSLSESKFHNQIEGSALFFRSLAFYNLLQEFSTQFDSTSATTALGIPLVTTTDINSKTPSASLKDSYEFIINDLKKSLSLLPDNPSVITLPSRGAAFALLSRAHLVMGDYPNCLKYANESLAIKATLQDFNKLDPTAYPVFAPFSPEEFFHAQLDGYDATSFTAQVDSDLYKSYDDPNDLRLQIFFNKENNRVGFNSQFDKGNVVAFSLSTAEMRLNKSECEARLGNKDAALHDLNLLLSSRWVTGKYEPYTGLSADETLKTILKERRKELVMTGLRWSDIRRLNTDPRFAKTLTRNLDGKIYTLPPKDNRYVLPIPSYEISFVTPPKNRTGKRTKSLNFNQSNNEEFYYHRSTDCKGHQRV